MPARSTAIFFAVCGVLVWALAGCGAAPDLDNGSWRDRLTPKVGRAQSDNHSYAGAVNLNERKGGSEGFEVRGQDKLIGRGLNALPLALADDGVKVTVNLLDAPIEAAAKAILGDILGLSYTVDARVQGQITIQTAKPITKSQLAESFQAMLRANGGAIVETGGFYRIVPSIEAARAGQGIDRPGDLRGGPGQQTLVIPIRYVSPEEIKSVLEPIMPEGAVIRADTGRNAIVVTGSAQELQAMQETISIFDVDWMRGMSFGLYPVKSAEPTAVVQELESIFSTKSGPLKGVVRFLPNQRLNSILVISARQRYLKEAASWIGRLDRAARSKEANLHVYNVQNRSAAELAAVLQKVFKTKAGGNVSVEQAARVAPKLPPVATSTDAATGDLGGKGDLLQNPDPNAVQAADQQSTEDIPEDTEAPEAPSRFAKPPEVSIVADDANNSLVIIATDDEYDRMLRVLQQIDSSPNQVMLEATIAEVALTDDLRFGVRWFFGDPSNRGTFSDLTSGAVSSAFPGFSYFFSSSNDIRASLSALASVTKVHVLSSPTLMVLDNRTATLQVGDQVPIITQQATSVTAANAPVVNTVELKDTGVILSVTPRVNDSGRVVLDIKQEVSDVVPTRTSGIDSPTIRQRKITTTVVVNDGDTLALGGLIQEKNSTGKTKVPVFGDIPLLGTAFREKSNDISRTELVIFIRPRVVRDVSEARRVTQEFRDQMEVEAPQVPNTSTKMGQDVIRILQ